jgi:hypothetical protein
LAEYNNEVAKAACNVFVLNKANLRQKYVFEVLLSAFNPFACTTFLGDAWWW